MQIKEISSMENQISLFFLSIIQNLSQSGKWIKLELFYLLFKA